MGRNEAPGSQICGVIGFVGAHLCIHIYILPRFLPLFFFVSVSLSFFLSLPLSHSRIFILSIVNALHFCSLSVSPWQVTSELCQKMLP